MKMALNKGTYDLCLKLQLLQRPPPHMNKIWAFDNPTVFGPIAGMLQQSPNYPAPLGPCSPLLPTPKMASASGMAPRGLHCVGRLCGGEAACSRRSFKKVSGQAVMGDGKKGMGNNGAGKLAQGQCGPSEAGKKAQGLQESRGGKRSMGCLRGYGSPWEAWGAGGGAAV